MKKLGLLFKETSQKQIEDNISSSGAMFIMKYSGISSPDLTKLRQDLKAYSGRFMVVQNSVLKRAVKNSPLQPFAEGLTGPYGVVFVKDEPPAACRVLCDFSKEHSELVLEKGLFEDRVLEAEDIQALSCLPSKEVLRAQVVMALNAPIAGLVKTLHQVVAKFVYCIDQIRKKKSP